MASEHGPKRDINHLLHVKKIKEGEEASVDEDEDNKKKTETPFVPK
jgi:hypothetical protein